MSWLRKIVKEGSKWVVKTEDGSKTLGPYNSKEAAEHRLKQIEYWKNKK